MKLDVITDGKTTIIREASGTTADIMAMACNILNCVAGAISHEKGCPIPKADLLRAMGCSVIAMAATQNPRKSAAADLLEDLEAHL